MSRQCHDSHHDSQFRISFRKYLQITKTVTMSPAFHVEEDQAEKFQAFPNYHFPSFSSCTHLRYGLTKLPCFCILTRGCEKQPHLLQAQRDLHFTRCSLTSTPTTLLLSIPPSSSMLPFLTTVTWRQLQQAHRGEEVMCRRSASIKKFRQVVSFKMPLP